MKTKYYGPHVLAIAFPLVYAAYSANIKFWDIRCEDAIGDLKLPKFNCSVNQFEKFVKLMLNEPHQLLLASPSLKGILEYDLRTLAPIYHQAHSHPLFTLNQGTAQYRDIIVSSGNNHRLDINLNVYKPNSLDTFTVFKGHTTPITCVKISDNYIASGAFSGDVRIMKFVNDKKNLKAQEKQIVINSQ